MNFTIGEILALVGVGILLGGIVAAYMIISRKKGSNIFSIQKIGKMAHFRQWTSLQSDEVIIRG